MRELRELRKLLGRDMTATQVELRGKHLFSTQVDLILDRKTRRPGREFSFSTPVSLILLNPSLAPSHSHSFSSLSLSFISLSLDPALVQYLEQLVNRLSDTRCEYEEEDLHELQVRSRVKLSMTIRETA